MQKRRISLSFRYKLILSSIACILIPAFFSLLLSNYMTQDAVKDQAAQNAEQSLKLAEGYVSNLLNNMTYIANYIQVVDSDMKTILQNTAALPSPVEQRSQASYEQFYDTKTIIDKIDNISIIGEEVLVTILLTNRIYFANYSSDDYDPLNIYEAPWFHELQDIYGLESKWIGAHPFSFRNKDEDRTITLGRTMRYANRKPYGYIVVTIYEEQVRKIFERIASNQEMMLLSEHGVIVSHRDAAKVGEKFSPLVQTDGDAAVIQSDNGPLLMSELPVSAVSGWRLVSLTPYKEAVSPINQIYNTVLMLQLISFFLFLLLLIYLLQKFTRPLVRLGKLAETVQRGNLEVRSRIRGDDEIGRLGFSFDAMLDRIKEMIREVTRVEQRKREAELAMLQAQINPHFVFNVLNSIRMKLLGKGDKESAEMISSMSRLMRMSIGSQHDYISLHEEIGIVIDYVRLMNLRQKENVELEIDVESDTFLEQVPRFILQPIIENAMIHGLNQQAGTIRIEGKIVKMSLVIVVEDDGIGMEEATLQQIQGRLSSEGESEKSRIGGKFSGIGLQNVVERMRLRYGDSFQLEIESKLGKGTRIRLTIPRQGGYDHVQSHISGR